MTRVDCRARLLLSRGKETLMVVDSLRATQSRVGLPYLPHRTLPSCILTLHLHAPELVTAGGAYSKVPDDRLFAVRDADWMDRKSACRRVMSNRSGMTMTRVYVVNWNDFTVGICCHSVPLHCGGCQHIVSGSLADWFGRHVGIRCSVIEVRYFRFPCQSVFASTVA